jgi:hypothetical protein
MKKILPLAILAISSCKSETSYQDHNSERPVTTTIAPSSTTKDTIFKSKEHNLKDILCDLDGDNLMDSVQIVQNIKNKKYGLKISFGDKKINYLGMGREVLDQDFDDFDWIGVFEKVDRGEIYWSNVDEDGAIIVDEAEIREEDKIKLKNDGIYVHQSESCGGGIIYLDGDKYAWIQQE